MNSPGKALQVRKPTLPVGRPTIALALGGGGARGLAHILMLEVFDELGIRPKVIAGTSIGAIFGAAYASGLSAKLIRAHAEEALSQRFGIARHLLSARSEPVLKILNILPIRSALLNAEALLELMLASAMARDFADLEIPLKIVATDYYAQEQAILTEGSLRTAVAASIALPALFTPVTINGRMLMDGGLTNPLPFDVLNGRGRLHGCHRRQRRAHRARQAAAPVGLFGADGVLADHAAHDRAREAQGAAAGHLHRRRGGRVLRARLPPLQADPGGGGPRQGAAAPPARPRPRQPDAGDAAGRRGTWSRPPRRPMPPTASAGCRA